MFNFTTFRIAKDAKIKQCFEKFIYANYDSTTLELTRNFLNEFSQLRNLVGYFSNKNTTKEQLSQNIFNCLTYIEVLNDLSLKMNVSKEEGALKINFSWKEASTGKTTENYNINYEICSVKFNLAVCFFLQGNLYINSNDANLIKESMKSYEKAAYVLGELKDLASNELKTESFPDFFDSYIASCQNFCMGMAQICVYQISEKKNMSSAMKIKLAMGVSTFMNKIANTSLSSNLDKSLVLFYGLYYKIIAVILTRDLAMSNFNKFGKGLGLILGYSTHAIDLINSALKLSKKLNQPQEVNQLNKFKTNEENFINKYNEENKKMYHETVVAKNELPKMDSDIARVQPLKYTEVGSNINSIGELNCFIPNEIKPMAKRYENEMNKYIESRLSSFLTEDKINEFILEKNLPNILYSGVYSIPLTDFMYSNVMEVEKQGGLNLLMKNLSIIEEEAKKLEDELNEISTKIFQENEEDKKLKLLYGSEWKRSVNPEYVQKIEEFKDKLNQRKKRVFKLKETILSNTKYYELFKLPKRILEARVPSSIDKTKLPSLPSNQALKNSFDKLNKDKEAFIYELRNLYANLTRKIPIGRLKEVLKGKASENGVLIESQSKFEPQIEKIGELNKVLNEDFNNINSQYEEYSNDCKKLASSQGEDAKTFFSFLNNAVNEFGDNLSSTVKTLQFYETFKGKLKLFSNDVAGYLFIRKIQKNDLEEELQKRERTKLAQNSIKK